ncbi:hypothetical protein J3E69DRAFT_355354 [Trichoderma sp. SZMC 28015]
MRTTISRSRFTMALWAGRYWQGVSQAEYSLAKRLRWSNSSRLHHVRYGLNTGQMSRHYTIGAGIKDQALKAPEEASKSRNIRLSPTKGLKLPISMPFTRLDEGTWLHNRPETDVYKLLVDAYRLRVEDTHTFKGEAMEDSVYAGCKNGRRGFRKFLRTAATIPGLLPPWWNKEKSAACVKLGMDPSQWQNLRCTAKKREIMEHYGDHLFPMQLRMMAEAVYGIHPCGKTGREMREHMMAEERGERKTTIIDLSGAVLVMICWQWIVTGS